MLTFYLILSNLFLFFVNGKYVCIENTTIYLDYNEIAFYETYDFPAMITLKEFGSCYFIFKLKCQNQTDYRVLIGYNQYGHGGTYNGFDTYHPYFKGYSESDYIFPNDSFEYYQYLAQYGFVVFDDGSDNCPLQSISNPFVFEDETQIIYFNANRFYNLTNSCTWKFVAPDGYGFKVIISSFDFSTKILISNSSDIITNERSLKLDHPYYNSDSFIQIYWFNLPLNIEEKGIFASISIVKKEFQYSNTVCEIVYTSKYIFRWTNVFPPYLVLTNYAWCTYNLTIPPNFVVSMSVLGWGLETNADVLQYYRTETDAVQIHKSVVIDAFLFEPNFDGFGDSILFEFKSDGSVPSTGFILEFQLIECKCNRFIECEDPQDFPYQTIMASSIFYCGNLSCILTIRPCSTDYGFMRILTNFGFKNAPLLDVFNFISNGETVLEIKDSDRKLNIFVICLNSSNTNVLEAKTQPSLAAKEFYLTYQSFNMPSSNLHVTLTSESPYIILDLSIHPVPIIEISHALKSKNLSFFIYGRDVSIFNNQSLSINLNSVQNCFVGINPLKCEIKRDKIALIQNLQNDDTHDASMYAAVRLSGTFDGCVFSETVFYTQRGNITGIANSKGTCDIILFTGYYLDYVISHLWTTSKTETVKDDSVLTYPHHSMCTTMDFGTTKRRDDYSFMYRYSTGGIALKFIAIYYNMSKKEAFYFVSYPDNQFINGTIVHINKIGDSVTFYGPYIDLVYNSTVYTDDAMFFIETLNISAVTNV